MREFALAVLVSFLFFCVIFFVSQLLSLGEDLLASRVAVRDAIRLMVYFLPVIVSFAIPFGTLLAALVTLGRLGSQLELLAMHALGYGPMQIFRPLIVIGLLLTVLSFMVSDTLLPAGNISFNRLYARLVFGNLAVELRPNSTKWADEMLIITGDRRGDQLRNVVIIDRPDDLERRVYVARGLRLVDVHRHTGVVTLSLQDVFSHTVDRETRGSHDYSYAQIMEYNVVGRNVIEDYAEISPYEQSSLDLWRTITGKRVLLEEDRRRRLTTRELSAYRLSFEIEFAAERVMRAAIGERASVLRRERERLYEESDAWASADASVSDYHFRNDLFVFHRRFALAFACCVFTLFAFRVRVMARRGGRVFAILVGFTVAAVYWLLLVGAHHTTLYDTRLPPALLAWVPNAAVFAFAIAASFRLGPWRRLRKSGLRSGTA